MPLPKPKLRELKEAVIAVFSPRFTTRFPAEPCHVPEAYRGKPEFDDDKCIGCGACVNVYPTVECLTMVDDTEADPPVRKITHRYDTCIFCGNCHHNCTTEDGIKLSNKWDLATLDRQETIENHEFELQMCEKCGEIVGTKKHLIWLYEKLGPWPIQILLYFSLKANRWRQFHPRRHKHSRLGRFNPEISCVSCAHFVNVN